MENEEKRPRRPRIGFSRQGLNNRENPAQGNYEQRDYSNFDWDSLYANLKKGGFDGKK